MADLQQILNDAGSAVQDIRRGAEERLSAASLANFSEYCRALAGELCNENSPNADIRQRAGLILKNAISSNDPKTDAQLREKWLHQINDADKEYIKNLILELIAVPHTTSEEARRTACQVAAKIARLEIPQSNWPQFYVVITGIVNNEKSSSGSKVAALLLLGYFSEDIHALGQEWNRILMNAETKSFTISNLSRGMTDPDISVRLVALRGFAHGILFAVEYLSYDADRSQLFRIIGESLRQQAPNMYTTSSLGYSPERLVIEVQKAAWEVMYQMVTECYAHLGEILEDILVLTFERLSPNAAMTNEDLALCAIEFWATVCDEELMRADNELKHYIRTVKDQLLPMLYEITALHRQDDLDDEDPVSFSDDEWRPNYAATSCLGLCAQVLKDLILPSAMKFIDANFMSPLWYRREGAVLVYSSILEGPSSNTLAPVLKLSFPGLCKAMDDRCVAVRDICAWTIGVAVRNHLPVITEWVDANPSIIDGLLNKTTDVPKVCRNVCYALYEILARAKEFKNYNIKAKFQQIATILLEVAKRADSSEAELVPKAFDVLYILVAEVGDVCPKETLLVLLDQYMEWIRSTLHMPYSEDIGNLQGSMIGGINAVIDKLGPDPGLFERAMSTIQLLADVVKHGLVAENNTIRRWSPATEDALLAYSKLYMTLSDSTYESTSDLTCGDMETILMQTIIARDVDPDVCGVGIECAGTIATYNPKAFDVNKFADLLFQILKETGIEMMKLKPKCIMTLGDLALNCANEFRVYLPQYFEFLGKAAMTQMDGPIEDTYWFDYIVELRDASLCGYSTAICCIRDVASSAPVKTGPDPISSLLEGEVQKIVEFIHLVLQDNISVVSNYINALRLLQDLISVFKGDVVSYLRDHPLYNTIKELEERSDTNNSPELKKEITQIEELMKRLIV